jgi:hypothetical protein
MSDAPALQFWVIADGLPPAEPKQLTTCQSATVHEWAEKIREVILASCMRATSCHPHFGYLHLVQIKRHLFDEVISGNVPNGTMVHYAPNESLCVVSAKHPTVGVWVSVSLHFTFGNSRLTGVEITQTEKEPR